MEARIKNYKFIRENYDGELPWVRIADLGKLELKRPIVLLNGCFDLLHSGHMKTIFHARKKAKTLICAMDSDEMVAKAKVGRPILSWVERATTLGFMPIDYLVEIHDNDEFLELVKVVQPDYRVKGAEYRDIPSRIPNTPTLFIRDGGIRTTEIIRRINESKVN